MQQNMEDLPPFSSFGWYCESPNCNDFQMLPRCRRCQRLRKSQMWFFDADPQAQLFLMASDWRLVHDKANLYALIEVSAGTYKLHKLDKMGARQKLLKLRESGVIMASIPVTNAPQLSTSMTSTSSSMTSSFSSLSSSSSASPQTSNPATQPLLSLPSSSNVGGESSLSSLPTVSLNDLSRSISNSVSDTKFYIAKDPVGSYHPMPGHLVADKSCFPKSMGIVGCVDELRRRVFVQYHTNDNLLISGAGVTAVPIGHSSFSQVEHLQCLSFVREISASLNYFRPVLQILFCLFGAISSMMSASYLSKDADLCDLAGQGELMLMVVLAGLVFLLFLQGTIFDGKSYWQRCVCCRTRPSNTGFLGQIQMSIASNVAAASSEKSGEWMVARSAFLDILSMSFCVCIIRVLAHMKANGLMDSDWIDVVDHNPELMIISLYIGLACFVFVPICISFIRCFLMLFELSGLGWKSITAFNITTPVVTLCSVRLCYDFVLCDSDATLACGRHVGLYALAIVLFVASSLHALVFSLRIDLGWDKLSHSHYHDEHHLELYINANSKIDPDYLPPLLYLHVSQQPCCGGDGGPGFSLLYMILCSVLFALCLSIDGPSSMFSTSCIVMFVAGGLSGLYSAVRMLWIVFSIACCDPLLDAEPEM
eukprot:TRINITY_DN2669_c0_g1_i1.p1 TRINITY_DN2669_c0_g1~~TRINITY_DN2669_c0_g1_i1.p1  ORF type:complete len:651 (-),score=81.25 TRINITY_DN2669_c0_g1_i1:19-1971(-)